MLNDLKENTVVMREIRDMQMNQTEFPKMTHKLSYMSCLLCGINSRLDSVGKKGLVNLYTYQ